MNLVSYWVVGFSGARHLPQPENVRAQIGNALRELKDIADGELVAVSSAAIGGDLLFVQEAMHLKIPWIAVLPFPEDYFFNEKDFPGATEREAAKQAIARAADCEIISIPRDRNEAAESTWRHAAFADAGFKCVDECDVFIAVLEEAKTGKPGGTSEVVDYAEARGRPILIIDPATQQIRRENWPVRLHDSLTEDFRRQGSVPPSAKEKAVLPTTTAIIIAGWRNGIAHAARKHVPGIRWVNTAVVVLHTLAMIITALVFSLLRKEGTFLTHFLETTSFLFVLSGFAFLVWLLWKKPHARGANYRFAAEIGRSLLATWNIPGAPMRLLRTPPGKFAHFVRTLVLRYRLDPERTREVDGLSFSEGDVKKLAADYVANRIEQQRKNYYLDRYLKSRRIAWRLEAGSVIFSAIAVSAAAVLAFIHPEQTRGAWVFVKLASATAAPLALSLLIIHEVRRRAARYYEMEQLLAEYARQVCNARSLATLQNLVVDVEHLLLSETFEWWILAKENVAA